MTIFPRTIHDKFKLWSCWHENLWAILSFLPSRLKNKKKQWDTIYIYFHWRIKLFQDHLESRQTLAFCFSNKFIKSSKIIRFIDCRIEIVRFIYQKIKDLATNQCHRAAANLKKKFAIWTRLKFNTTIIHIKSVKTFSLLLLSNSQFVIYSVLSPERTEII